jgi:hypothetical protein
MRATLFVSAIWVVVCAVTLAAYQLSRSATARRARFLRVVTALGVVAIVAHEAWRVINGEYSAVPFLFLASLLLPLTLVPWPRKPELTGRVAEEMRLYSTGYLSHLYHGSPPEDEGGLIPLRTAPSVATISRP